MDAIFGREWLHKIKLNWKDIRGVDTADYKSELQKLQEDVFTQKIGLIPNYSYSIRLEDPATQPIFIKARTVLYAIQDQVEEEIKRLEKEGVLEKKDNNVRLCSDYKATINKALKKDRYPISKIEDIFNKMNGEKFSVPWISIKRTYIWEWTKSRRSFKLLPRT